MTKRFDALLSDLLSTHPHDPANARYVVPLDNPEEEEIAHDMAGAMCQAFEVDHCTDDTPQETVDRVYEQCLIDARRMICDPDYERILISTGPSDGG